MAGMAPWRLVVMLAASIYFVMRYAARVKAHPETSLMASHRADYTARFAAQGSDGAKLTWVQSLALALFALTFLVMIYAVIPFDDMGLPIPALGWWFPELSGLFLLAGILAGLIYGMGELEIVEAFVAGAADLIGVAFIIGISRGITVLMDGGRITDTVLYWGEQALEGAGSVVFILLVFLIYLPLSILIPSSSGLATLSIPVMAPLGRFAGIDESLVVTAFQSASGLVNLITPTAAVVMGGLAFGRVPYDRWVRFVWKLILIFLLLCLGSNISLTVSPRRLKTITVRKIAQPGARITHGDVWSILLPLLIMEPHSAVGGVAPRPRNDSPAISIIMVPISRTAVTITGPAILGTICFKMIFPVPEPASRAAEI